MGRAARTGAAFNEDDPRRWASAASPPRDVFLRPTMDIGTTCTEEEDMRCPACGHLNPSGSRFCVQCGAAMARDGNGASTTVIFTVGDGELTADADWSEEPIDVHAGAVESLPAGSALLVVKRGPNAGSRFLLDQDVTSAGRHPDSDIFLDDVSVSRRHAEFRRESGGFSVHDVGSLNGTYVNRERADVATLSGGDEVQIGKFRLVYLTRGRTGAPSDR